MYEVTLPKEVEEWCELHDHSFGELVDVCTRLADADDFHTLYLLRDKFEVPETFWQTAEYIEYPTAYDKVIHSGFEIEVEVVTAAQDYDILYTLVDWGARETVVKID
jgi:hypothetical protein